MKKKNKKKAQLPKYKKKDWKSAWLFLGEQYNIFLFSTGREVLSLLIRVMAVDYLISKTPWGVSRILDMGIVIACMLIMVDYLLILSIKIESYFSNA